jgi:hypothetical protein
MNLDLNNRISSSQLSGARYVVRMYGLQNVHNYQTVLLGVTFHFFFCEIVSLKRKHCNVAQTALGVHNADLDLSCR